MFLNEKLKVKSEKFWDSLRSWVKEIGVKKYHAQWEAEHGCGWDGWGKMGKF